MKFINIHFELTPNKNLKEYIAEEAIWYWFNEHNFTLLIKQLFGDKEFNTGEFFDFTALNSKWVNNSYGDYPFSRDISKDFENVMLIKRKTYSAYSGEEAGNTSLLTYELDFPNY